MSDHPMAMFRVLIIGVGSIGERHLRCFQSTGRAEVGICELDVARRQTVAQQYSVVRDFADLRSAIHDGFDAAVVCTPANFHIAMACDLLAAGIPVLIEKPLSTSLDGTQRLRELAAERTIPVAVAYTWRAFASLGFLRERVRSGEFGRPLHLTVTSGQHFPAYRPAYRDIYYNSRRTGGGAIQDAITHLFNACEWVIGPITRLCVDAEHQALPGVTVEDTVNVLARHGDVLASYALNQFQAPNETTITIACERGTLRLESHRNRVSWLAEPGGHWQERDFGTMERDTPYRAQANAFLDLLEGQVTPNLCTLDEGLQTLRVNLAALASMESRAWQTT